MTHIHDTDDVVACVRLASPRNEAKEQVPELKRTLFTCIYTFEEEAPYMSSEASSSHEQPNGILLYFFHMWMPNVYGAGPTLMRTIFAAAKEQRQRHLAVRSRSFILKCGMSCDDGTSPKKKPIAPYIFMMEWL